MAITSAAMAPGETPRVHFESESAVHGERLYPLGQVEHIEHNRSEVEVNFANLRGVPNRNDD